MLYHESMTSCKPTTPSPPHPPPPPPKNKKSAHTQINRKKKKSYTLFQQYMLLDSAAFYYSTPETYPGYPLLILTVKRYKVGWKCYAKSNIGLCKTTLQVLGTTGYVDVEQNNAYGDIQVCKLSKMGPNLWS